MSTTLTLTTCTIAPISDLTDTVSLGQTSEGVDLAAPIDVRRYAGGRDRLITGPGSTRTVSLTFAGVSRDDFTALQDLVGVAVLVRDQRGLRVWGTFGNLTGQEFAARDLLASVTFTIQSITHSEVV